MGLFLLIAMTIIQFYVSLYIIVVVMVSILVDFHGVNVAISLVDFM